MDEYIKRESVLKAYEEVQRGYGPWRFEALIESVPAEEVIPIIHGRWLDTGNYGYSKNPIFQCSNCRKEVEDYYIKNHKFCLHCGAKMDGE